eukprot:6986232-Prorocentrum_lima.AAC.1
MSHPRQLACVADLLALLIELLRVGAGLGVGGVRHVVLRDVRLLRARREDAAAVVVGPGYIHPL